ncbi:MAG: transferase hexapeptide repeat family protein [Alphaproteobacteria bacterium]|nr:transferase hexapeptide repeat family protein [Alphaproteobacteria bacterium]
MPRWRWIDKAEFCTAKKKKSRVSAIFNGRPVTETGAPSILAGRFGPEVPLPAKRRDHAPIVYSYEGLTPVVPDTSFVHPTAVLIGDVIVGEHCYIGPGASLRGDLGRLTIGDGSNVQDNCVLHSFPGKDVILEPDSHVGHGVVLHGCIVRRNALIGMNSVIMDGAEIGEDSFVAAMTFVRSEFRVPPRTLVAGIPAKVLRELTDEEIAWKGEGTREYQQLAARSLASCRVTAALERAEPNRPRHPKSATKPLAEQRKSS